MGWSSPKYEWFQVDLNKHTANVKISHMGASHSYALCLISSKPRLGLSSGYNLTPLINHNVQQYCALPLELLLETIFMFQIVLLLSLIQLLFPYGNLSLLLILLLTLHFIHTALRTELE